MKMLRSQAQELPPLIKEDCEMKLAEYTLSDLLKL